MQSDRILASKAGAPWRLRTDDIKAYLDRNNITHDRGPAVVGSDGTLQPGDIVSGVDPSELVEIVRKAPFGKKTLVEGRTAKTRREIKRPFSPEELAAIVKVRGKDHTFDGSPKSFSWGQRRNASASRISLTPLCRQLQYC